MGEGHWQESQGGAWPGDSEVASNGRPQVRSVERQHASTPTAVQGGSQRHSALLQAGFANESCSDWGVYYMTAAQLSSTRLQTRIT